MEHQDDEQAQVSSPDEVKSVQEEEPSQGEEGEQGGPKMDQVSGNDAVDVEDDEDEDVICFEDLDDFEVSMMDEKLKLDNGNSRAQLDYKQRKMSTSTRDFHGFELKKEQVEAYQRFEPVLKEEERERRSRWATFMKSYRPVSSTADTSESLGTSTADEDSDSLNLEWLEASVRHVLKASKEERRKIRSLSTVDGEMMANAKIVHKSASSDLEEEPRTPRPGEGESDAEDVDLDDEIDVAMRELQMLVQNGVPNSARGLLWRIFLEESFDVDDESMDEESRLNLYQKLSMEYSDDENEGDDVDTDPSLPHVKLIEKDIPRTLPGHKRMSLFIDSGALRRLLIAYCRLHPEVGYCQGMNFVAGLLLIILESEDKQISHPIQLNKSDGLLHLESAAFWCLDAICNRILVKYYSEDMTELQVDQLLMQQLVEEKFPTVASALDRLGVSLACVSSSWLLCAFANALPWTTLVRAWDVLLFPGEDEGRDILIKFTLALVDIHARSLITCNDATQLIILLQSMAVQSFDSSQLVTIACMGFPDLVKVQLEEMRQMYRPIVIATFSRSATAMTGGMASDFEDPEVLKVRDRLGLRRIDEHPSSTGVTPRTPIDEHTPQSTARSMISSSSVNSRASNSSAMLRRRFLGSSGIFTPLTASRSVRRATSLQTGIGNANADSDANYREQIMQMTSVRHYLEKQVVDLIAIIARMNKDLKKQDVQRKALEAAELQVLNLTGSIEAIKDEMKKKVEELEEKDDIIKMLQEKITKQSAEILQRKKQIKEQSSANFSPIKQIKESASKMFRNKADTPSDPK